MSFNYLQTDDRDDYFDAMERKKGPLGERRKYDFVNIDNPSVVVSAFNKDEAMDLLNLPKDPYHKNRKKVKCVAKDGRICR